MRNTNLSRFYHTAKQKADLECFLEALGWPWNAALSLELDSIIQALEVNQ